MDHTTKTKVAATLLALLQVVKAGGSIQQKKVQIHVPHNIQHHHHTHTKYHFITLPLARTPNQTDATTTLRPTIIMPIVPVIPGMVAWNNTGPTPPAQPPTTTLPTPTLPPAQPQQPNFAQLPNFFPINPNAMYINDYEYVDTPNRRSREKVIRVEQPPPIKFKTVINVQETKKIPLTELLNFNHLLQKEPPRRIKVDVYPDKTNYVKQTQKIMADWHALQETLKAKPYPGFIPEKLEFDTDAYQSRQEVVTERPEWETLKKLLEKHIHEDFPGLKVKAEIKQVEGPMPVIMKEKMMSADERSGSEDIKDSSKASLMEYKHIGFIVVDSKNNHHFVGVNDPNVS